MEIEAPTINSGPPDYRTLPLSTMEDIVARFKDRVDAAQLAEPTDERSCQSKAVRRQGADRCLTRMYRFSTDVIVRYGDALADLLCQYPDDVIFVVPYDFTLGYQCPGRPGHLTNVEAMMQENANGPTSGASGWKHAADGVDANRINHPIKDWSQLADYLRNQIPDPHQPGRSP